MLQPRYCVVQIVILKLALMMCRIVNYTMCKVIFYFTLHLFIGMLSGNIPHTAELNCEGLPISYGVSPTFLQEGRQSTLCFAAWDSQHHTYLCVELQDQVRNPTLGYV